MISFLFRILDIFLELFGDRIVRFLRTLFGKNWLKWNILCLLRSVIGRFLSAAAISLIWLLLWFFFSQPVFSHIIRYSYRSDIHLLFAIRSVWALFLFFIVLFYLSVIDWTEKRASRKSKIEMTRLFTEGRNIKDYKDEVLDNLAEQVHISKCTVNTLLDQIREGTILVDRKFRVFAVNNVYQRWCSEHHVSQRIIGKSVFDIYTVLNYDRFTTNLFQTLIDGAVNKHVLLDFQHGKHIYKFSADFIPVRNSEIVMCLIKLREVEDCSFPILTIAT